MARCAVAALFSVVALLAGCGGEDEARSSDAADDVRRAIRATRAQGTVSIRAEYRASGGPDLRFDAQGRADFGTGRERYRLTIIALPGVPEDTQLEIYSEPGRDYIRRAGQGRFERIPASEQSPVPNGITDSLGAIATDTTGITRAGSGSVSGVACTRYRARLDAARIAERADLGREEEAERTAAVLDDAPVSLCIDERDLLRQFTVEFGAPGGSYTVRAAVELMGFGETAPLSTRPVGVDE